MSVSADNYLQSATFRVDVEVCVLEAVLGHAAVAIGIVTGSPRSSTVRGGRRAVSECACRGACGIHLLGLNRIILYGNTLHAETPIVCLKYEVSIS
jgi:hypothetical protein